MLTEPEDKTAVDHDETVFFKRPSSSQPNNRITLIEGEPHGKGCQFGDSIVIGRSSACGLTIENDRYVSREHARIQRQGKKQFRLTNIESKNTTLLNGKTIGKPALFKTGDRIRVGDTTLKVDLDGSKAAFRINDLITGKIKIVLSILAILLIAFGVWNWIDWTSSEVQVHLEKGNQLFKQKKYQEAKSQFQLVLDIDSEHKEAKERHKACIAAIERNAKAKKIKQYLTESQKCFEHQDYNCALAAFKSVLKLDNQNSTAKQKIKECRDAIDAENKKIIEQITDLLDKAEKVASSIDAIELKDSEILEQTLKQLDEAENDVNQAIGLCAKEINLINDSTRRNADGILKAIQKAKIEIKKLIESLEKVRSLYQLAKDFSEQKELLKALLKLKELVAMNVNCEESIKARQFIPRLKQMLIDAVKSPYKQGSKLYRKRKYSQAIIYLHRVYSIYPDYQEIERLYLATISKLKPEAQRLIDEGNVYEGIGKTKVARQKWTEVLKIIPIESNELHQEAKRKLSGQ